jgi:hypothetical protein
MPVETAAPSVCIPSKSESDSRSNGDYDVKRVALRLLRSLIGNCCLMRLRKSRWDSRLVLVR